MDFCIDGGVLGTEQHLVCSSGSFSWHGSVPDVWHLSGEVKHWPVLCMDTLFKLSGTKIDLSPPKNYANASVPFLSGSTYSASPPWFRLMPSRAHRAFTERIVQQVMVSIDGLLTNYWNDTWGPGQELLSLLQPACIDKQLWEQLMDVGAGNIKALASFMPEYDGYAMPVTYDRIATVTGRLTVKQGPQILTLKKEHRRVIVPSRPGHIVSMDFASLEPRILLYEAGKRCESFDMYSELSKELDCDRKAAKGAVISELYGSSKWALGRALNLEGKALDVFVKRVKQYFRTKELLERVKQQFIETGYIVNRYGRRVYIDEPLDNIMISYYGQSTGVDVALQGFLSIVKTLKENASSVRPLFVLHDALILDVPSEHLEYVRSINTVTVKGYVQKFPLKCEVLS